MDPLLSVILYAIVCHTELSNLPNEEMIPVATAKKQRNGDGKDKNPDIVKTPPMTREEASGNFSSGTFLPEHSSALHPLILLLFFSSFFSFSSSPSLFFLLTHIFITAWCFKVLHKYNVRPLTDWGKLPQHMISQWNSIGYVLPLPFAFYLSSVFSFLSTIFYLLYESL
jgi:hypothetical protein